MVGHAEQQRRGGVPRQPALRRERRHHQWVPGGVPAQRGRARVRAAGQPLPGRAGVPAGPGPTDGSSCGQARIVVAKPPDAAGRNLAIFEASIPNPEPGCGLSGCRKIAQFWANLSTVGSFPQRLDALERFYFTGLTAAQDGVTAPPVLAAANLGLPDASGARRGQIRTNQFMNGPRPAGVAAPRVPAREGVRWPSHGKLLLRAGQREDQPVRRRCSTTTQPAAARLGVPAMTSSDQISALAAPDRERDQHVRVR